MNKEIRKRIDHFLKAGPAFQFLVEDFAFRKLAPEISKRVKEDTTVAVPYVGERVGVKIVYAPYEHDIGVSFIELQEGQFPSRVSFYKGKDGGRAVTLDTLIRFKNGGKPDYPLPAIEPTHTIAEMARRAQERERLLQTEMDDVMLGLAERMRRYAESILQGDVSEFSAIQAFHSEVYD